MRARPAIHGNARVAVAMAAALALAGCAGRNFVRVGPGNFTLGKTRRAQVYARVGPHPDAFHELHVRGKDVWTMTYRYMNNFSKGLRPEISPVKAETFYFLDNVLVGIDYTNSFKGQGTDFDAGKIGAIHKGVSTRRDVIRLFGPPGGLYAPPLIPDADYRALVYYSRQIAGQQLLSDRKLVVSYNRKGVVTGVKYTATGHP